MCVKEREGGSPRSQKRLQRDGPRYLKTRILEPFFKGEKLCLKIFVVSLQDPRTVALVENVGRGGGGITRI